LKKQLSDAQRILLRKQVETEEWYPRWAGRLSNPLAYLDLFRWYHRRGLISLDSFRLFKRQGGFYDNQKQNVEVLKDGTET
jgi:hypothetical protein